MLNDLKDLEKAIKICRRLGVQSIKVGDVEVNMGSLPTKPTKISKSQDLGAFPEANIKIPLFNGPQPTEQATPDKIETDEPTEEQMLMWSAQSVEPVG